jgi:hypothetical protein
VPHEVRVPEPSPGVLGRRRGALQQPQRLLHQRQSGGRGIDPPLEADAEMDNCRSGGVAVVGEPAIRLLRDDIGPRPVAGRLEHVHRPDVKTRHIEPVTEIRAGFRLA